MFDFISSFVGTVGRSVVDVATLPIAAIEDTCAVITGNDAESLKQQAEKLAEEAREIARLFS